MVSSVIGGSSNQVGVRNPTLIGETSMTTAKPLARYGAIWGRASRAASLPPSYTITRDVTGAQGDWQTHAPLGEGCAQPEARGASLALMLSQAHAAGIGAGEVDRRNQGVGRKCSALIGPQHLAVPFRGLAIRRLQSSPRDVDLHLAESRAAHRAAA